MKKLVNVNFSILALVSFLIYTPIILTNNPIDIDHSVVIEPIEKIKNFSDYKREIFKIYDIQPIRDLFFRTQAWIKSYTNFQIYTFTNWVLSVLIAFILFKSLSLFEISKKSKIFSSAIFLLHPIMAWTIYWPTAQKHLLASFLISFSAFQFLKKWKSKSNRYDFKIWLLYLLSIFSQPITIFAIIPYFCIQKKEALLAKDRSLTLLLLLSFVLCLGLNLFYYSNVYPVQAEVDKVMSYGTNINLANAVLSLSRSFSQILFPISFSVNYSYLSVYSFLGLPLFVLLLFRFSKTVSFEKIILFIVVALFPLISVYSKVTNIFVSDTYLIWTTYVIAGGFSLYGIVSQKTSKITLSIAVLILCSKTFYEVQITKNRKRYFSISYEREPTCKNATQYLSFMLNESKIQMDKYSMVTEAFLSNKCHIAGGRSNILIINILSVYFFITEKIVLKEKIKNLESFRIRTLPSDAVLLALYQRQGRNDKIISVRERLKAYNKLEEAFIFIQSLQNSINRSL